MVTLSQGLKSCKCYGLVLPFLDDDMLWICYLTYNVCTCTYMYSKKQCNGYCYLKCNYMYMSVPMLINSLFLVATPCLAVIFLTMHMRGPIGEGQVVEA